MGAINNRINIYQGNTAVIDCSVSGIASLSGYTATFTVKKEYTDINPIISVDGSIIGSNAPFQLTFSLSKTVTNISKGNYRYEITLDNSVNFYTVIQDSFIITDSIVK